jgi:adenylate cyclase
MVAERFEPDALMDWLNTYMDAITRTVMEHGGVVDDFFGDGVKVNFGVPIARTSDPEIRDDAMHAVDCALALEAELIRLNAVMQKRNMPSLRMRVGLFTGPVVAGSLGSSDRQKYTTLGDTVNTAARLEQYDKGLALPHLEASPCRILVGDSTLELLGDRYETVRVGEIALGGKQKKVVVHSVIRRKVDSGQA